MVTNEVRMYAQFTSPEHPRVKLGSSLGKWTSTTPELWSYYNISALSMSKQFESGTMASVRAAKARTDEASVHAQFTSLEYLRVTTGFRSRQQAFINV
ncbi:hypothetical protein P3342_005748 [Pyrenophora teres f. teres]|nr:hypothetical protein P3342_005748 [Pyrenophora teres f. teres]